MIRSVATTRSITRTYAQTWVPEIVAQGKLRDLDLKALGAKYQEGELGELQFPFSKLSHDQMYSVWESAGKLDYDLPRHGMLNWDNVPGMSPGSSGVMILVNGNLYNPKEIVVEHGKFLVPSQQGELVMPTEGFSGGLLIRWTTALPGPDALYEVLVAATISAGIVLYGFSGDLFSELGAANKGAIAAAVILGFLLVVPVFLAIRWIYQNVIEPVTRTLKDLNQLGILGPALIAGGVGLGLWALSRKR